MGVILSPPSTNVPLVKDKKEPLKLYDITQTWYRWFIDVAQFINNSGGKSGSSVAVRVDGGAVVGSRRKLNLIQGPGIVITVTDDDTDKELEIEFEAAGATSGFYTPAGVNVANLDAFTMYECQWSRAGDVITVTGKADVDPTAPGVLTLLGIPLPTASNLGAEEHCAGVAFSPGVAGMGAAIRGDAANNRAEMAWIASSTASQSMFFSFSFRVI